MTDALLNPQSLLENAVETCGSLSAVARASGVDRSTLKHIRNGNTTTPHAATLAKLLRLVSVR